jgi:hypothetical protein
MSSLYACVHWFISKRESEGCVGGQIDNNVVGRKWKNNDDLSSIFFFQLIKKEKCVGVKH